MMTACSTVPTRAMPAFLPYFVSDVPASAAPTAPHPQRPNRFERQDTLELVDQVAKENLEKGSYHFSPMHDSLPAGAMPILHELYSTYNNARFPPSPYEDMKCNKMNAPQSQYQFPRSLFHTHQELQAPYQPKQEPIPCYYVNSSADHSNVSLNPPGTNVFESSSIPSSFYQSSSYPPLCSTYYSPPSGVASMSSGPCRKRPLSNDSYDLGDEYLGETTTNSPSCSTVSRENYSVKSEYTDYQEYMLPSQMNQCPSTMNYPQPAQQTVEHDVISSLPYAPVASQESTFSTSSGTSSGPRKRRRHGAPTRATNRSLEEMVNHYAEDNRNLEDTSVKLQRMISHCQYLVDQVQQQQSTQC